MSTSTHNVSSLLPDLQSYPSGFKEGHPWESITDGGRVSTLHLSCAFHANVISARRSVFILTALDLGAFRFAHISVKMEL
ncbi:hypothetical protein FIBSPDRAFT_869606 [Athelia psychrophila]|uniref:Uncharacterized protein n=1 Tax=Athelia psychrophila TaxID=1759441 RepID=A0A166C0A5_9AGAM|nr:hypothetical protein FIBSPDRAFT_869579 [Fibularhizoctonia sp. CBS 109695]KZP13161.1 hypothetical protein FIBSPDRAFT_869606 [Fibularhizoctonia sp. CBS 109695]